MFKLELHCHSRDVSDCATCSAEDEIRIYREAGYSGIVTTNHINRYSFKGLEDAPWEDKVAYFMVGYEKLKAAAGDGFDVLLGCEINLSPLGTLPRELQDSGWTDYVPNDYLVYGVTEDWLLQTGDVRTLSLKALSASAREAGFLIVHAHPFRAGTVMRDPDLFDGYEVYNGGRAQANNDLAEAWSDLRGKIKTSGSDFHHPHDVPTGGILTEERIRDNGTLLRILRSGGYTLVL
jgi:hypothetical protein